jgi:hypothetical protein
MLVFYPQGLLIAFSTWRKTGVQQQFLTGGGAMNPMHGSTLSTEVQSQRMARDSELIFNKA